MPRRGLETSVRFAGVECAITIWIDGSIICIGSEEHSVSLSLSDFGLVVAEVVAYGRAVEAAGRMCSE
jgi:hypothetical protein